MIESEMTYDKMYTMMGKSAKLKWPALLELLGLPVDTEVVMVVGVSRAEFEGGLDDLMGAALDEEDQLATELVNEETETPERPVMQTEPDAADPAEVDEGVETTEEN